MKSFPSIRSISKSLIVLALAFSGFSCASVSQTLISPEIQSPAISEDGVIDVVFSKSPGREVDLFDDASARPPLYSGSFATENSRGGAFYGGIGWGAVRGVSVSGGLLASNALTDGLWIGGKLQLIGPQGLLADSPLTLATYARAGGQGGSKEGDRNGDFGPHGFPWEADRTGGFFNAGLSLGYSFTESFMAYVGAGKGIASARGTVDQEASGGLPAASYTNSFDANTATWGGGLQFGRETRIAVSLNRTRVESGGYRAFDSQVGASVEIKIRNTKEHILPVSTTTGVEQ